MTFTKALLYRDLHISKVIDGYIRQSKETKYGLSERDCSVSGKNL